MKGYQILFFKVLHFLLSLNNLIPHNQLLYIKEQEKVRQPPYSNTQQTKPYASQTTKKKSNLSQKLGQFHAIITISTNKLPKRRRRKK